jgi:hypothetical protein
MSDIIPHEDTPQKRCYKCKEFKPRTSEHFGPDKRSGDHFRNICKPCRRIQYKEDLERNPDMEKIRYRRRYKTTEAVKKRREYLAEYMYEFRQGIKDSGICSQCKRRPCVPGHYCDRCREYMKTKKEEYRHKWPQYGKEERDRLRQDILDAYGSKCQCCGETQPEFLAVDHVNNDGARYRRYTSGGSGFYRWLRKHGFPTDNFQLLCMNCNWGKYICGGTCPHNK